MDVEQGLLVKIGGGTGIEIPQVCADIARRAHRGQIVIVVHGASEAASRLSKARGLEPQFLTSPSGHVSRYTTREVREVFVEAAHAVNDRIVAELQNNNVNARGLVGDRCPLRGRRKRAIRAVMDGRQIVIRNDYSGRVTDVDHSGIASFLQRGIVPVIPPLAYSDEDGFLNVDGDRAAAAIAAGLETRRFVILSNVPGLMRDYPNEDTVVPRLDSQELERALEWAHGRMKRKLLSVNEALEGGVSEVVLADGRASNPVQRALRGEGTLFHA